MFNILSNLDNPVLFIILMIWSLIWKGLALWRAGVLKQKIWFVVILVISTAGILEIIYLLITQKRVKSRLDRDNAPGKMKGETSKNTQNQIDNS